MKKLNTKFKLWGIGCGLILSQGMYGQVLGPGETLDDHTTCFDAMGRSMTLSMDRKFGRASTEDRYNLNGFTIPLVADLNGDGYPEIIVTGTNDNSSRGHYRFIDIYKGDGTRIDRLPLVFSGDSTTHNLRNDTYFDSGTGYHTSPSIIALADVDRDGYVEIFVAYPNTASNANGTNYVSRLVAYTIKPIAGGHFSLHHKWGRGSTVKYNQNIQSFSGNRTQNTDLDRPVPQIVDFDGDGNPEVLVYNKMYDAKTGDVKLEFTPILSSMSNYANSNNLNNNHLGLNCLAQGGSSGDRTIAFPYIYDIDGDGIYDIAAGGTVYKITKSGNSLQSKAYTCPGIGDGYTGVADIDGDGTPDVVIARSTGTSNNSGIAITVWKPNFGSTGGTVIAQNTFDISNRYTGSNSYIYIGDIDGRVQTYNGKQYRLPEIAILSADLNYRNLPIHTNVPSNTFPTSGTTRNDGCIFAVTYDPAYANVNEKLRVSFILEHEDSSTNTGFTMFDFDNDGISEICYRDMKSLRILKGNKNPYNGDELITNTLPSYTGFEYPVIADIDNDASADIIVMGHPSSNGVFYGYVYAYGTTGDKLAPALKVWNQFMYDPFKINEDLTVPTGPAPNRLSADYTYTRIIRDQNLMESSRIENYRPFNATLAQSFAYQVDETSEPGKRLYEPLIYLTEAFIVTTGAEQPKISGTTANNGVIEFYVGNKPGAKTDVSAELPVSIYKDFVSPANFVKKVKLGAAGVTFAIKAGKTGKVTINSSTSALLTGPKGANIDANAIYVLRLGDDSNPAADNWSFGTNIPGQNNPANHTGSAKRAYRDCDWSDQEIRLAKFWANDDIYTIQEYGSVDINLLANDIIPGDAKIDIQSGVNGQFLSQPVAGDLAYLSGNVVRYSYKAKAPLANGIESFRYKITYTSGSATTERTATVYIFILQSEAGASVICHGEDHLVKLKVLPDVRYYWSSGPSTPEETAPKSELQLTNLMSDVLLYIRPEFTVAPYSNIVFPRGQLRISVVPKAVNGQMAVLKWSGDAQTSDWFNPNNWTDGAGNAVTYIPTTCVDIILPAGKSIYPSLSKAGKVHNIDVKNRAMLGNVFRLAYNEVDFELKLTASERNRWLMYSAPLAKTYSGDFMLRGKDGYPIKKAVYMSFFQESNPDNSSETATALVFTPTFSKEDVELTLGRGFVLYVDGTRDTGNTPFQFPSPADQYEYYYDDEYTFVSLTNKSASPNPSTPFSGILDRGTPAKNKRFITEMAPATYRSSGDFSLATPNDRTDSKLLMLVNPFNAYLDVNKVLTENSAVLTQNRYYIWNGSEKAGFISFQKNKNQWIISNPDSLLQSPSRWIPPYQAFFVLKNNPASLAGITVSELWTTTENAGYQLRSGLMQIENSGNVWYVNVSSREFTSRTALFAAREASHTPALFFNDAQAVSLDVYALDKDGKAASITGFTAETQEVPLGLRMKQSGEVEWDLQGLDTGKDYQIYLKDGKRLIDLSGGQKYKTAIVRPADADKAYFEINSRFRLLIKKSE